MTEIQDATADDIEEIKKKRFIFLHKLYSLVDGVDLKDCRLNAYEIGDLLEFDRTLTRKIWIYLLREKLITHGVGDRVSITHKGIMEVEEILSKKNGSTKYFPSYNIIYVKQATNSQFMQASPEATQTINISSNRYNDLKKVIEEIKSSKDKLNLNQEQISEFNPALITIDTHLSSTKPNPKVINESLFSIRRVLETVAGNVTAKGLMSLIDKLF